MKVKTARRAFTSSLLALLVCFAMLVGTTFAWFTDTASTNVNKIQSGILQIDLASKDATDEYTTLQGQTLKWQKADNTDEVLWEPGVTYDLQEFYIINKDLTKDKQSNLALKYSVKITGILGDAELLEAIDFTIQGGNYTEATSLENFFGELIPTADGNIAADGPYTIQGHMKEEAGNEYQDLSIDGIAITVYATQLAYEYDTYTSQYDASAPWTGEVDADGLEANTDKNAKTVKIESAEQLAAFAASVNDGNTYEGYTITLEKDIDLNGIDWTPIGNCYDDNGNKAYHTFKGTFDGQNHTISNLYVSGTQENTPENAAKGLFGYTESPAVIKNVKLNNVNVNGSLYVGALVGHPYTIGEISNITVTGDVKVTGYWYVGSVVGKGYLGVFKNISVDANDGSFVKGVTPANEPDDDAGNIGGVVGWTGEQNSTHNYTSISVNNVDVTGVSYVGGIFGHLHTNCVVSSSSVSNAEITGTELVGEYAGRCYGTVEDSTTKTNVKTHLIIDVAVGGTQEETQINLDVAINRATSGDTVVLPETEYSLTLTDVAEGVTIKGNGTTKIEATGTGSIANVNGAVLEGLVIDCGNNNYHGFYDSTVTLKNCTINGLLSSYGNMTFEDCVFNQTTAEYNMWAYSDVTYKNCIFNNSATGKFVNVYTESGTAQYTVNFENCTFNNTSEVSNKAAINVKDTCGSTQLHYTVNITNCTTTGAFPEESSSTATCKVLSKVVQVDDIGTGTVVVNVNGTKVYPAA